MSRGMRLGVALAVAVSAPVHAQTRTTALDSARIATVTRALADSLLAVYVYPQAGRDAANDVGAYSREHWQSMVDPQGFADAMTARLRMVMKDAHVMVRLAPDQTAGPTVSPATLDSAAYRRQDSVRLAADIRNRFGFHSACVLAANVGYLDLRGFSPTRLPGASDTAHAAMARLIHTDALILDLRNNGGGNETMVSLVLGYLFDRPVHLNDVLQRDNQSARQIWSTAVAEDLRYGSRKPVFALTSEHTFSAGEAAAFDLQALHRGTIVGAQTAAGANAGAFIPIAPGFEAFIPTGAVVNPTTRKNWDGVGVHPDVVVPAQQAFLEAYRRAVRQLSNMARPTRRTALQVALDSALKAPSNPDVCGNQR